MKCFRQRIISAKIEYHWWRIKRLRKKQKSKKDERLFCCENLHKYRAKELEKLYEVSLGLRDEQGIWTGGFYTR